MTKKLLLGLAVYSLFSMIPGISGATGNTWTWMSGSDLKNQPGIYGTQGVADAANVPGARYDSTSWTGSDGNLWLFGGIGYDYASGGNLNDLWRYDLETNTWTWMNGSDTRNQPGI